MRKIFEKYNPASHPFGGVKVAMPVSSEKLLKIVSFEDLDEPIFVKGFRFGYISNGLPTLKIVHLNKDGQAVVLFGVDVPNYLHSGSYDLGLFKVASGDKLVIEAGISGAEYDLFFELGLTETLPVYRCYEFKKVSVSEPVRLLRGSFDTLRAVGLSGAVVNGREIAFLFGDREANNSALIVGNSYYPFHLDISVRSNQIQQAGSFGVLVLMKEKYNRDIIQTRIHQLEALKESFLFDAQNDYDNTELKAFLGRYVGIERVPSVLDGLYASALNSKYKGVYDVYEVPEVEAVSDGSGSGVGREEVPLRGDSVPGS